MINLQVVPLACKFSTIVGYSNLMFCNTKRGLASASRKIIALSPHTSLGMLRRQLNRWKAAKKFDVIKSLSASRCTAFVLMQMNITR